MCQIKSLFKHFDFIHNRKEVAKLKKQFDCLDLSINSKGIILIMIVCDGFHYYVYIIYRLYIYVCLYIYKIIYYWPNVFT